MITFKCTQCGHEYSVQDDYAGKKARCKNCQTVNTIPAPAAGRKVRSCEDSIAAYNNLLQELLRQEKQAPAVNAE